MSQNGPEERRLKTVTEPTITPFFLPTHPVVDDQWQLAHQIARTFPDPVQRQHLIFLSTIPDAEQSTKETLEAQLQNGFLAKIRTVLRFNNRDITEMTISEIDQKNGLLTCLIKFETKALSTD